MLLLLVVISCGKTQQSNLNQLVDFSKFEKHDQEFENRYNNLIETANNTIFGSEVQNHLSITSIP